MNDIILSGLSLRRIYKNIPKEVRAVDGIDIDIKKGESVAIVGPSGAGKSTLLHILGGLEKPTAGKVLVDGVDMYRIPEGRLAGIRNEMIGFVFQFYHLLPEFTVLENVILPALIHSSGDSVSRNLLIARAKEILALVGLKERFAHKPPKLSGGESQRVAIARAIINSPPILLCDEPTGNLDSENRELIYELLFGLRAKLSMSLIIVTHDDKVSKRTDRFIHIKDGKVV